MEPNNQNNWQVGGGTKFQNEILRKFGAKEMILLYNISLNNYPGAHWGKESTAKKKKNNFDKLNDYDASEM